MALQLVVETSWMNSLERTGGMPGIMDVRTSGLDIGAWSKVPPYGPF